MSTTLLQGDCLDLLPTLEAGSVDLILADLPYGTTACKWDSVIPLDKLWPQYKRVLKPRGAVVLTASQPFTTTLISSNLAWFKYCWVWAKTRATDHINAHNKPLRAHEDICVFSPGTTANRSQNRMTYQPQGLVYAPHHHKRPCTFIGYRTDTTNGHRPSHTLERDVEWANYPTSVLRFPNPNNGNHHPTQKPVALMEYLIRTYSNPGDLVLDNTMGSGTTGAACINTRRDFIGMEQDAGYFQIARDRIAATQPPLLEASA